MKVKHKYRDLNKHTDEQSNTNTSLLVWPDVGIKSSLVFSKVAQKSPQQFLNIK